MSVRACCVAFACLVLAAGCQNSRTALFPWTDDSSAPRLAEAELERSDESLTINDDAFRTASAESLEERMKVATVSRTETSRDKSEDRLSQWLARGQDAIARSAEPGQSELMLTEARRSFREVLRIDPDYADAHHGLAIVSDLSGEWELAEHSYKRALAARPNDANLLNDLGYSYLLQSRYREASEYLNRVLQISPAHEKAQINLAILDIRRGNPDEARTRLAHVFPPNDLDDAFASYVREHGPAAAEPPPLPGSVDSQRMDSSRHIRTAEISPLPRIAGPSAGASLPARRQTSLPVAQSRFQESQPVTFGPDGVIRRVPVTDSGRGFDQSSLPQHSSVAASPHPSPPTSYPSSGHTSPLSSARSIGGTFRRLPEEAPPSVPPASRVDFGQMSHAASRVPSNDRRPTPYAPVAGAGAVPPDTSQHPVWRGPLDRNSGTVALPAAGNPGSSQQLSGTRSEALAPHPDAARRHFEQGQMPPRGPAHPGGIQTPGDIRDQRPISVYPASTPLRSDAVQNLSLPRSDSRPVSVLPHGDPHRQSSATSGAVGNWPRAVQSSEGAAPSQSPAGYPSINPAGWIQPSAAGGGFSNDAQQSAQLGGGTHPSSMPSIHAGPMVAPHASPPPVMGTGFQEHGSSSSDRLEQYRATRQQLENDYHRTLQTLAPPTDGRVFR